MVREVVGDDRPYWGVVIGAGGLAGAIVANLIKMRFKVVVCSRR
jgi:shikimate 5-dehydrogenase